LKRFHEETAHMQRQKKVACGYGKKKKIELGRFRKRKAMDCGKTKCGLCHNDKFGPKRTPTRKEVMHDLTAE